MRVPAPDLRHTDGGLRNLGKQSAREKNERPPVAERRFLAATASTTVASSGSGRLKAAG
jgi:hypothetical protein